MPYINQRIKTPFCNIDLISVKQIKTGKRVWIPASDDLKAALDPWLRSHNYDEFFRTPIQHKPLTEDYMSKTLMRDAIDEAGLPKDCTLHGLRYTFATRGVELGLDIRDVESIIGHEATEMMWKYIRQRRQAELTIDTMNRSLVNRRLRADDRDTLPASD